MPDTRQPCTTSPSTLESMFDRLELFQEAQTARCGRWHASLEKIGLQATVLREQPDQGHTTIEKFEAWAIEVGFAVVLTTDDLGGAV